MFSWKALILPLTWWNRTYSFLHQQQGITSIMLWLTPFTCSLISPTPWQAEQCFKFWEQKINVLLLRIWFLLALLLTPAFRLEPTVNTTLLWKGREGLQPSISNWNWKPLLDGSCKHDFSRGRWAGLQNQCFGSRAVWRKNQFALGITF